MCSFSRVQQAVSHAIALIQHIANKQVDVTTHTNHDVTGEWLDNQIEKEVDRRQGVTGADRAPQP